MGLVSPLPRNWRTIRRLVLDRDGGVCQIRGEGCTTVTTNVDHIVAQADGGSPRPSESAGGVRALQQGASGALEPVAGLVGAAAVVLVV